METTITLEFFADTHQHLEALEHQLKQIHGIQVLLVLPKDSTAPALISLGIGHRGEQAERAIGTIGHVLYDALHSAGERSQKISLVTIEGENIDISSLGAEEIKGIIADAYTNQ
jgi:hypothetical protein